MNTFQKTTKSGKPVINKQTKLPEFELSVHTRIALIKKQLGITGKPSPEQRWDMIINEINLLEL